jgi:hypothetical protein
MLVIIRQLKIKEEDKLFENFQLRMGNHRED